jgi:hypothetical protein
MSETMQQVLTLTRQLTSLEKIQLIEKVIPEIELSFQQTIAKVEREEERNEWLTLSAQGLELAYGNDEPEYLSTLVKEPNPKYKP